MPVGAGWEVPTDVRDRVEFHWFHVPKSGALVLAILSQVPVWYVGHFDSGRMKECGGIGCDLCSKGIGRQLRYVVSAVDISTKQVGVFEFGSSVSLLIKQWASGLGYLHGMIIEVTRASKSKHSRMEISLIREHPMSWVMSLEGLPLEEVLERTWERAETI
jgi:hypothetical protein